MWQILHRSLVFHIVSCRPDEPGLPLAECPTRASKEVRKSISTTETAKHSSWCSNAHVSVLKIIKPAPVPTARHVWSWFRPRKVMSERCSTESDMFGLWLDLSVCC